MLQGWGHKVVTILLYHDWIGLVGTTLQQVWWYHQGCYKLLTTCSKLVDNLGQQCEHNLLTACLQTCYKLWHLVASLPTVCQQVVFELLVPNCRQVWNNLLTTCNNLVNIIGLVARLFQQVRYSHDITILLQHCVVNLVTFLLYHDCISETC